VQNPVRRLITLRRDHSAGLFLLDSDAAVDVLEHVTSSAGLCVVEATNSFYWIDDVTGSLTSENYASRVSRQMQVVHDRPQSALVLTGVSYYLMILSPFDHGRSQNLCWSAFSGLG